MRSPRRPRAPCRRRRGAGARPGPKGDCHQRQVGADAQSRPGLSWDALKTRSSGARTLAASKCPLPCPALPRSPSSHPLAPTPSPARWQSGAEERLARRGHLPSWPSADAKSTSLLQILKFPLTACCLRPARPGLIGASGHLTGIAASPAAARLSSRSERADNSRTHSANEAERRSALTRRLGGGAVGRGLPRVSPP